MVYPGSNFAASRTESARSIGSNASSISVESAQATVRSIRESPSITALARSISIDLGQLDGTLQELKVYHQKKVYGDYKQREPWPQGMQNAYGRYKAVVTAYKGACTEFEHLFPLKNGQRKKQSTYPENHVERARLALRMGELAVQ